MQVGLNAYPLYKGFNDVQSVTLKADGDLSLLACVQGQKTLMVEVILSKKLLWRYLILKMLSLE
jgi:hypothetical protein